MADLPETIVGVPAGKTSRPAASSLKSVTRSVHFFEPAVPGRPAVPWIEGLGPDIVREQWPCWGDELPKAIAICAWYRKLVIYERSNPAIRFVVFFSDPDPVSRRQRIIKHLLEWDPGAGLLAIRRGMKTLLDEFCKIEVRGRPRGSGHPKRNWLLRIPEHELTLQKLKKLGLDERDIRIVYARLRGQPFVKIAKEFKVTPQAIHIRFKRRIVPKLRKLEPSDAQELVTMLSPANTE